VTAASRRSATTGSHIYVDPVADVVIVRLGSDWGFGNERWLALFRQIADAP
jgi:hypothetical protein